MLWVKRWKILNTEGNKLAGGDTPAGSECSVPMRPERVRPCSVVPKGLPSRRPSLGPCRCAKAEVGEKILGV